MRAICHLCGATKPRPMTGCGECGEIPTAEGRGMAYLLSDHHLSELELLRAAQRIRAGQPPQPGAAVMGIVLQDLVAELPVQRHRAGGDPQSALELLGLTLVCVMAHPLLGLAAWWGWRQARPEQARCALLIAGGAGLVELLLWTWSW